MTTPTGQTAQEYLSAGLSVIPLRPHDKIPAVKWDTYQVKPPTPAELARWWADQPAANVGIVTGGVSGVIVLDIDGPDGEAAVRELGEIPETPTVRTGKGRHCYFAHPGGTIRNFARKRPGLDLRADGGQVVAPPSIHPSGAVYEWEIPLSVGFAWPPAWLIGLIRGDGDTPATRSANTNGNGRSPSDDAGAHWLGYYLDQAAPGNRNETGFKLACQLRDAGLSETEAEAVMLGYAARVPQGQDPYTDREALASLRKAFQASPRDPAQRAGAAPQPTRKTPASSVTAEPPAWLGDGATPDVPGPPHTATADEPPATTRGEHLTDLGNARRMVARHGPELRYCHPWAKWLVWDGRRWTTDSTAEAVRRAKDTVRSMYAEAAAFADEDSRKRLGTHALKCEAAGKLAAMLELANSEPGIPVLPDQLDANPWTLNVLNGAIDLRTGQLWPHRRQDLLTKLAPVAYDPDALCPTWDRFLLEVMNGDQDLVSFLQRTIGYTLTGDTSEQVIFILHGKGANGKSTLLETLRAMLGDDYTVQVRPETLMVKQGDAIPNDIARLKGARLVNARETEEGKRLAEALVKEMSGGDTITARFMRSEFFDFKPEFKLFLAANHKPTIRGTDLAIWRRIRLIPFAVTFTEDQQDKQLPKKLQAELPGILAWAVRGCLGWQVLGGLGTPAAVKRATEEYRSESDLLAAFLADCTEDDPKVDTQANALFEAYKSWCEVNGEKAVTGTAFGRRLTERGFDKYTDKRTRRTFYIGLKLSEAEKRE